MSYRFTTLAFASIALCSLVVGQELNLGADLGRNSMIMAEVTERIPVTLYAFLKREDVRDELKLSAQQGSDIDIIASKRKSFVEMRSEIDGSDGTLQSLGDLDLKEAMELKGKLIKSVDAERGKLVESLKDTLKDSQQLRLSQVLVQHEILHGSGRSIPRYGMPPAGEELSKDQMRAVSQALYKADRTIRKLELIKLKYKYYRAALDDVLGEGTGEKIIGKPFGFIVHEQSVKEEKTNPRRNGSRTN